MGINKHKFNISSEDDNINVEISGTENKSAAYNELRDQICESNGISIREFESTYEVSSYRHKICFEDKSWSNEEELINDIESIDMITQATLLPAEYRHHKPPRIQLIVKDEGNTNEIKKRLKNYCNDFKFEERNKLYVILDPR